MRLRSAGPGPPRAYARDVTVGELATKLGVPLEDLVRTPLLGMLAPGAPFFCTFAWDIHHEAPVTTVEDLARREVLSYDGWSADDDKPRTGLEAVRELAPGASLEFNPPVLALELAALLGVADPVARTVGVHMASWEVELGDAVATLDGSAAGETYSLPAALGARVVAADRVRLLRR
jgi:hypothetical protein